MNKPRTPVEEQEPIENYPGLTYTLCNYLYPQEASKDLTKDIRTCTNAGMSTVLVPPDQITADIWV